MPTPWFCGTLPPPDPVPVCMPVPDNCIIIDGQVACIGTPPGPVCTRDDCDVLTGVCIVVPTPCPQTPAAVPSLDAAGNIIMISILAFAALMSLALYVDAVVDERNAKRARIRDLRSRYAAHLLRERAATRSYLERKANMKGKL